MIPGNELILKCPYCLVNKSVMSLISGSSGGAIKWSDGYTIMPMYPQNSEIQQCDKCGKFFWMNERNMCGYASSMSLKPSLLDLSQWVSVLEQFRKERLLDGAVELSIRLHILWEYNHGQQNQYTKINFNENSNHLLTLMDRDGERYLTMSAEIYRELGLYDKCLDLLHSITLDCWGKEIEKAAAEGVSDVFILRNNCERYRIFI